jgi:hypothetical protein
MRRSKMSELKRVKYKKYLYQVFIANDFRDRLIHKYGDEEYIKISEEMNRNAIKLIDDVEV